MKDKAIVCNIGHFDNEIDMAGLQASPGVRKEEIKPQVHQWHFPTATASSFCRGPAGEPGLRHRSSQLRHEQQLLQPGSGPRSNSGRTGSSTGERSTSCPSTWTRRWPGFTWRSWGPGSPDSPRNRPATSTSTWTGPTSRITIATEAESRQRSRPSLSEYPDTTPRFVGARIEAKAAWCLQPVLNRSESARRTIDDDLGTGLVSFGPRETEGMFHPTTRKGACH